MAEAVEVSEQKEKGDGMECAVCLQKCIHPAQLPCGHIFCYLCVKGFANQNKKCAMCRQEIPRDFIEQPTLLEPIEPEKAEAFDGGYQWFYEGRNGWWQYDERTSKDLEMSYKNNEKTCELLIAGFLYVIDFDNMLQIRRNDPLRRRRIKRDHSSSEKKGVAGIHKNKQNCALNKESTVSNTVVIEESNINATTTENADAEDELENTIQRLNFLHLQNSR